MYFLLWTQIPLPQLTPETDSVTRWSERLGLSPPEYLESLCKALQKSAEDLARSPSATPEHVFELVDQTLNWKQYFKDKNLSGKRGSFPLQKVPPLDCDCLWIFIYFFASNKVFTLEFVVGKGNFSNLNKLRKYVPTFTFRPSLY